MFKSIASAKHYGITKKIIVTIEIREERKKIKRIWKEEKGKQNNSYKSHLKSGNFAGKTDFEDDLFDCKPRKPKTEKRWFLTSSAGNSFNN